MLAKTGLLIVSNPKHIGKILPVIQENVKNTLYIQLLSALSEPLNFHSNVFNSWPKYSKMLFGIYSQAAQCCQNLDVRVLLTNLKYNNVAKIQTNRVIDVVILDKKYNEEVVRNFVKGKIANIAKEYSVITLEPDVVVNNVDETADEGNVYNHSILGGTFDRLHVAHKVLLSEAVLRTRATVTVGVTEENMLKTKLLWELVEDIGVRQHNVKEFLMDVDSCLDYNVVPIADPFGPAIEDGSMEMIIVSDETIKGGNKINEIRSGKNLPPLDVIPVRLIDEPCPSPIEEKKISSSTGRIRLLGTLLRPLEQRDIPNRPYVIGLTGSIASGKSGVAKWLADLGGQIVNCDLIGHSVYEPGRPCFDALVEVFGASVVGEDGKINRRVLGGIVFSNSEQMGRLNAIVWPAIAAEVQTVISETEANVVVVEAAVLLQASWQQFCHEVWATIVPREEQVKRLIERNGLTEEQANARINLQPSNSDYVKAANVVFCPYWDPIYTKEQVQRAWNLLNKRMNFSASSS